jgi:Bacterial Ig-like domain (group 3)
MSYTFFPCLRNVASRLHINLVTILGAALLFSAGGPRAGAQTTTSFTSTGSSSSPAINIVNSCGTSITSPSITSDCNSNSGFAYSTINVPSGDAGTVTKVVVTLNGVSSSGNGEPSEGPVSDSIFLTSFYLVGPGGQRFELLGCTGNSGDGDNSATITSGLKGANITIEDGEGAAPGGTATGWSPGNGNFTVAPSSYWENDNSCDYGSIPINAAGLSLPQTDASAKLNTTFGGGASNGNWTLYVDNDDTFYTESGADPISVDSWTLAVTYNVTASASTTTTISSGTNPSNSGSSVTYTATVSSSSTVSGGTVTFTSNGNTIACTGGNQTVSSGTATCTTSFTQGLYTIGASYSGTTGFLSSSTNSDVSQLVEGLTTSGGTDTFCNTSPIPLGYETTSIYPSIIKVTSFPGQTVSNVEVKLLDVTGKVTGSHLLVSPDGNHNLDFLDNGFNESDSTTGAWMNFYDTANAYPNTTGSTGPPDNSSSSPANYVASDEDSVETLFPSSGAHAVDSAVPSVPGTVNYGYNNESPDETYGPVTETFGSNFSGASADGDWALYPYENFADNENISGGWCVALTVNTGVQTTTSVASSQNPQVAGQTAKLTATVTANGNPVTSGGSVTFLENGVAPPGTSGGDNVVTVNGSGQAPFTTAALPEGDSLFVVEYSGDSSDNASQTTFTQRANNNTNLYQNGASISHGLTCGATYCYCNAGAVSTNSSYKGAFTPNPSIIDVTNLPGTIGSVTLALDQYSSASTILYALESMVVSPTGADLDFFSNAGYSSGGGTASLGNYIFSDAASSTISSSVGTLSPGTYQPASFVEGDPNWPEPAQPYTASSSGFYTLPSAITYAEPRGSGTFTSQFENTNPNGNWALYLNEDDPAGTASAANGWCVNLTENAVNVSADVSHVGTGTGNDFLQGETNAQLITTVTNGNSTGPTGDPLGTNPLTVTDTLNPALTYESFSGAGWSCAAAGQTVSCTNDIPVAEGVSYPALTLNVNVSSGALGSFTNSVSVSGAGVASTTSNSDTITIEAPTTTAASNASITFSSSAQNVTLTATVTNSGSPVNAGTVTFSVSSLGTPTTSGTVTNGVASVSYALPAGAASGTYQITATYNPVAGYESSSDNSHNLTIDQQPAITSAASSTFATGSAGSFTVTTSGYPAPALSESGLLPNGVTFTDNGNGTASLAGTPVLGSAGTYPFTITASNGIGTNGTQSFTLTVTPPPSYVVTTNGDDATGNPLNCPTPSTGNTCTLRDALAAAAAAGSGVITFDGTAFSASNSTAQNTILLPNGTLTIPANTSITGPTSGSGYTLSNLVAVDGGGTVGIFYSTSAGVTVSNLAIQNGNSEYGSGIFNYGGVIAVANSTFTNNTATAWGGAILGYGTTTVTGSTFTGNSAQYGGGILNYGGPTTITNSTFYNNSASLEGGGIYNNDQTTVNSSTVTGNSAVEDGGGIEWGGGTNNMANSIVSGNSAPSDADANPFTDLGGNLVALGAINLAPIYNYGGPTQTMIPLPGSPAICGALASNIPGGVTTDQRGLPNLNTTYPGYTLTTPCVDSGAVQTNYAMSFIAQPPATVNVGATIAPAPVVTLTESGNLAGTAAGTVTMTDNSSVLSGTTSEGLLSGTATFTGLVLPSAVTNDIFTASLALNLPLSITAQATQGVTALTPVPAVMQSPTPGATTILGASNVEFQWSAGVDVTSYELFVGTAGVGTENLYASGVTSKTTFTIKNFPANGVDVYVKLGSLINGTWQYANYVYTESGTPTPATLTPSSGTLSASQTFTWNNGAGPAYYELFLGTNGVGSSNLYDSNETTQTSATVSLPSNGVTVYGTFKQLISGAWQVTNYTFTEPGTATPATLTPSTGTLSASQTFTWSNGVGPVDYVLLLGTNGQGSSDLYNSEVTTATSATVSIPSNGVTVFGALRQLFNGTWMVTYYTFTEPGTAAPATLSPSSGTLSSSQTFTWKNGVGPVDFVLLLGTTGPGSSDLYNSTVTTATSATVSIPSNGVTVFGTLRQLFNGAWQATSYTFTEPGTATPATLTPSSGTLSSSQTFTWNNGVGPVDYVLLLGTSAVGSSDLYNSEVTSATSATVTIPSDGLTVYGTLRQLFNGTWMVTHYTFTESGTPTPATLTPSSGTLAASQLFTWNNGAGPVDYVLLLGTTAVGSSDLYNSEVTTATSATVTIPSDGLTVYGTLRQLIGGTWMVTHYTFTESGAPTPATLTPSSGTLLASQTFTWSNGSGAVDYVLLLGTTAPGSSDIYNSEVTTATSATVSIPSKGVTVYATLRQLIGGTWQVTRYTFTEPTPPAS